MIHKYKGYHIEFYELDAHEDTPAQKFFEAKDTSSQAEIRAMRKQFIERPWHGLECECEICTYTEEDHAHNRKIQEKIKLLQMATTTFQEKTLKACKQKIDKLTETEKQGEV